MNKKFIAFSITTEFKLKYCKHTANLVFHLCLYFALLLRRKTRQYHKFHYPVKNTYFSYSNCDSLRYCSHSVDPTVSVHAPPANENRIFWILVSVKPHLHLVLLCKDIKGGASTTAPQFPHDSKLLLLRTPQSGDEGLVRRSTQTTTFWRTTFIAGLVIVLSSSVSMRIPS